MKTTSGFQKMKSSGEKIAMMTAYDAPSARGAEQAGVDLILVGDSAGMVVHGYDSTVPVTLEDMILHTKAVRRGAPDTFVVTDMPFLTYHEGTKETVQNARRLIQEGGAHAVKMEGAGNVVDSISALTSGGVPVMAHLGLTPQSVGVLGGYKVQGKSDEAAHALLEEAKEIESAGAFSIVLECVPKQLAELVSKQLSIPVIGIGAGKDTDGQVLVYHDVIGYGNGFVPKFVKQYSDVDSIIEKAIAEYVNEVKEQRFPEEQHTFTMKEEQLKSFYGGVK
ncbi:3-methyl-2-oxobutanoate hydroxymethyltransferase [Thalassorhabdus alkalitolerans]|uniref:3-methyl-2-oxobutanoate hydroxymethyltransferase n=1 Tax=Thalassorhabdus alkalitolerans TaxID=2282697 RepID=A0ABW0YS51_9BACI|nr:3-methyl-2-oxobutanoate hydroxymethyltransferase [Thalassobacillus sp. C254]